MGTASGWTPERRAKQAVLLRRTRPWEKSTGPKTAEGKAVSSQNARLPEALREARERIADANAYARALFGRQRRKRTR